MFWLVLKHDKNNKNTKDRACLNDWMEFPQAWASPVIFTFSYIGIFLYYIADYKQGLILDR